MPGEKVTMVCRARSGMARCLGAWLRFGLRDDHHVQANPVEGIHWTFPATTNFHPGACWPMYRAYNEGVGVQTNPVLR